MNLPGNEVSIRSANNWVTDDVVRDLRASPLAPGTVLFAKIGEALRQNRRRQVLIPTLCDNNMMGAIPRPDVVDPVFLYYALLTVDFMEVAQGTALPYLTVAGLSQLAVPAPPLPEQRRIARILGALDDKIGLNRRISEMLEATAQALYGSWFGSSTKYLEFGDVADLVRDSIDPQGSPDTLFDHHSLPAFDSGGDPAREFGSAIKSVKTLVPAGSVLLSKLNPAIERVWLTDSKPGAVSICSTEFLVLKPRPPVDTALLYCLARSDGFRRSLAALATGTSNSHQRVRTDSLLKIRVPAPSATGAARFGLVAGPLLGKSVAARGESKSLREIRDALLPQLLSGESFPPRRPAQVVGAG